MDGENDNNSAGQPQPDDANHEQPMAPAQPDNSEAQLAAEEAMLEAQAQSLAEVKRRRKE